MKTLAVLTFTAAAATSFAGSAFAQEQGRVLSTTPITQQVAVPQQVCSDQQVAVAPRPSGAGAVVGAIAGGLLGNAIGGGGGRAAATGAGLIGGAMLGNQVEATGPAQYQTVRQCSTQTFYQNRTIGFNVTYEYNGRNYTTQTTDLPGKWIALNVQPAANSTVYNTNANNSNGYYSNQAPVQGAYSTSYPQDNQGSYTTSYPNTYPTVSQTGYQTGYQNGYQSGYYAPQPVAPTYSSSSSYSATDFVGPLLLGAVIGAGAYYATRPSHYYRGYGGYGGYRHGYGGHGWRR